VKIVVAYKWAANPADALVADDGTIDWSRAKCAVSEYDPCAIELGRRLADATGAELIGVSAGDKQVASSLAKKAALARGLDRLVLVINDLLAGAGPVQSGLAVARAIEGIGEVDLVIAGDASVDGGSQTVPAVIAGALGWPALSEVTKVSGTAGDLTVERAYRGGSQVLRATGPVVLAAASDAVTPRVPGMKDILAASRKPSEEVPYAAAGTASTVEVTGRSKPQLKARLGRLLDASDPDAAAAQLIEALKATANLT
jgi:electron transfer flavoprotein beta subunit